MAFFGFVELKCVGFVGDAPAAIAADGVVGAVGIHPTNEIRPSFIDPGHSALALVIGTGLERRPSSSVARAILIWLHRGLQVIVGGLTRGALTPK